MAAANSDFGETRSCLYHGFASNTGAQLGRKSPLEPARCPPTFLIAKRPVMWVWQRVRWIRWVLVSMLLKEDVVMSVIDLAPWSGR